MIGGGIITKRLETPVSALVRHRRRCSIRALRPVVTHARTIGLENGRAVREGSGGRPNARNPAGGAVTFIWRTHVDDAHTERVACAPLRSRRKQTNGQSDGRETRMIAAADTTEPPARYPVLDGLVSVTHRRQQIRAALGLGFWLGAPLYGARILGRLGRRRDLHTLLRWWARGLRRHLRIRLHVEGLHHIDRRQQYIITPLHEGFVDAIALLHLPLPFRAAARDELFDWHHFGAVLQDTGQLPVCPEAGAVSYRQLYRQAPAVFAGGESLVLFPQGSILGIETDFRAGPFALALALNRPVLPVVLTGSHRVWEHPYSSRLRYGQQVSMVVLEPLAAAEVAALGARGTRAEVQRRLKARALAGDLAAPRRYVPARDGYWDGYAFEIDPAFGELHAEIARHRAGVRAAAVQPASTRQRVR